MLAVLEPGRLGSGGQHSCTLVGDLFWVADGCPLIVSSQGEKEQLAGLLPRALIPFMSELPRDFITLPWPHLQTPPRWGLDFNTYILGAHKHSVRDNDRLHYTEEKLKEVQAKVTWVVKGRVGIEPRTV